MNPSSPVRADVSRRLIAWFAVIATMLPDIIWQECGHRPSVWLTVAESSVIALLALAAIWVPSWRALVRFLFAISLLTLAWRYIAPAIANSTSLRSVTDHVSWGARLFLGRLPTLVGAVLLCFTLIGSGVTRRDLFLCKGDLAAPAQPIPFLG